MAERRDATGVDVIRGLVLSRVGTGARSDEPLTERDDWFSALADVFDLRFEAAVAHPFVADLDEDTLRAELLHVMRRLLELPD